jgi:hypothetical protein
MRCSFCGEPASENTQIHPVYEVCNDCLVSLIDNEAERRGEARDAAALAETGRDYSAEFRDRQLAAQELKR